MVCQNCNTEKSEEEFYRRSDRPHLLQSRCKVCWKEYTASHYKNNKAKVAARSRERDKRVVKEIRNFVLQHLLSHPCVYCGESDPVVLQFDHVNGKKEFNISEAVRKRCSLETLCLEMDKCEVRCANCHVRRTAVSRGYWICAPVVQRTNA